jgi:hypothetical protein
MSRRSCSTCSRSCRWTNAGRPDGEAIPDDVVTPRKTNNAAEFALLLAEVAPGFTTDRSGGGWG